MNKILYRPIIVISATLGLFIMIELVALGSITWRNLQRIDTIKQDIAYGHQLQQLIFELYQHHLQSPKARHDPVQLNQIIESLQEHYPTAQETQELINKSRNLLLTGNDQDYRQELMGTLLLAGVFFNQRIGEEEQLLSHVYSDSELELNFAIIIPALAFLMLFLLNLRFLRNKIMAPLDDLKRLLSRLVEGEMLPIEDGNIEPMLQPLFTNYNRLIIRLCELEQEHANHRQLLEQEVRNATHTLLEQSHSLARAERLAAIGELAASAAHELRNPLAGIQAALKNMHNECTDPDLSERLELVSNETKRLTSRLNELLAFSKHAPEKAKAVDLTTLLNELLTLLKYQAGSNVALELHVTSDKRPVLPESELRHALLNLLLNAIQELSNQTGKVMVDVFGTDGQISISVQDTGPGFPGTLLTQGIRPFASTHEYGTGLGLSMVQRFTKANNGQLTLNNNEEGHACATLSFPV
ncbi:MAG: sensor histidine kinase [Gammaproteobacteria bacterium]